VSSRQQAHPHTRVALDATPLLGARTGVGRYVEQLIVALRGALPDSDAPELTLVALTWRGSRDLADVAPIVPGVTTAALRVPARLLRELWARTDFPPGEFLSGPVDVWHGTNFVLPPTRRSRGVVTVHDLTYLRFPEWVTADVARYVALVPIGLRRAAAVCTPSHAVRSELLESYPFVDPDRVIVTPLCVEAAFFTTEKPEADIRAQLGLPADYLLFLGSAEPRKGLDVLIEAYRLLHRRRRDLPVLLIAGPAGWGPRADYSDLPHGLVTAVGYQSPSQVRTIVAGATALVYPSRYEGFGLPPLEAFAAGVPAIVSDLPVTREVLGDVADFAAVDDPESVGQAIELVLNRDRLVGQEARRLRAAAFTPEAFARATLSAYRRALA
jgi:glycosyltransferase involved in cell wall biosynthesis